jgi:hypothetical protein
MSEPRKSHVFLVGIKLESPTEVSREAAELHLHACLNDMLMEHDLDPIQPDVWWIAEDDRHDNSDNDSAVFVPPGMQRAVREMVVSNYEPYRDDQIWKENRGG